NRALASIGRRTRTTSRNTERWRMRRLTRATGATEFIEFIEFIEPSPVRRSARSSPHSPQGARQRSTGSAIDVRATGRIAPAPDSVDPAGGSNHRRQERSAAGVPSALLTLLPFSVAAHCSSPGDLDLIWYVRQFDRAFHRRGSCGSSLGMPQAWGLVE